MSLHTHNELTRPKPGEQTTADIEILSPRKPKLSRKQSSWINPVRHNKAVEWTYCLVLVSLFLQVGLYGCEYAIGLYFHLPPTFMLIFWAASFLFGMQVWYLLFYSHRTFRQKRGPHGYFIHMPVLVVTFTTWIYFAALLQVLLNMYGLETQDFMNTFWDMGWFHRVCLLTASVFYILFFFVCQRLISLHLQKVAGFAEKIPMVELFVGSALIDNQIRSHSTTQVHSYMSSLVMLSIICQFFIFGGVFAATVYQAPGMTHDDWASMAYSSIYSIGFFMAGMQVFYYQFFKSPEFVNNVSLHAWWVKVPFVMLVFATWLFFVGLIKAFLCSDYSQVTNLHDLYRKFQDERKIEAQLLGGATVLYLLLFLVCWSLFEVHLSGVIGASAGVNFTDAVRSTKGKWQYEKDSRQESRNRLSS